MREEVAHDGAVELHAVAEIFIQPAGAGRVIRPVDEQRLADNPKDHKLKPYFHWIQGGVDFIYLDNATPEQFEPDQVGWFESVLKRATANPEVRAVVVGMHAALPDSLAAGHSMSDYPAGTQSGRQVYTDLLKFNKDTQKKVYILASHSHFYMSDLFDSDYWNAHGGVLPGWIVGTAGAMRYHAEVPRPLPAIADVELLRLLRRAWDSLATDAPERHRRLAASSERAEL